jgi:hypothetical protein
MDAKRDRLALFISERSHRTYILHKAHTNQQHFFNRLKQEVDQRNWKVAAYLLGRSAITYINEAGWRLTLHYLIGYKKVTAVLVHKRFFRNDLGMITNRERSYSWTYDNNGFCVWNQRHDNTGENTITSSSTEYVDSTKWFNSFVTALDKTAVLLGINE